MAPELKPSKIPVETKKMLAGKPTPIVKMTTDAISRAVIFNLKVQQSVVVFVAVSYTHLTLPTILLV